MKNSHEEIIKRELMDVPELPQDLYAGIERGIGRGRRSRLPVWAVAALVLLTFVTLYFRRANYSAENPAVENRRAVVEEELNDIRDYLDGRHVDDELMAYAIVNPDVFNFNRNGGTDE